LHLLRTQYPLSFNSTIGGLLSGSLLHDGSRRRRRRAHSVRHGAEIFSLGTTGSSHGRLLLLLVLHLLLLSWRRRSLSLIGTDTHGHRSKVFSFRTPTGTDLLHLLLLLLHLLWLLLHLLWLLRLWLLLRRPGLLSSLCCHQRSRRLAGAGHLINLLHLLLRWLHLLLLGWLHLLLLRWLLLLLRGSSCFLAQAPLHDLQGFASFAWWSRHDDD
jgi:hypothetical protein